MKMNWKVLKEPKFIIGGIVLFFVVLYMLNKSGSTSSGTVTAAPAPPVDNTIPLAQISASVANNQTAAALQAIQNQDATQIALATVGANSSDYQANLAATIAAAGITEQGYEANLAAQISQAGIAAQSHAADLQYETNLATINATVNIAQIGAAVSTYAIGQNTALQTALAADQVQAMKTSEIIGVLPQLGQYGKYALLNSNIAGGNGNINPPATNNNSSFPFGAALGGVVGAIV